MLLIQGKTPNFRIVSYKTRQETLEMSITNKIRIFRIVNNNKERKMLCCRLQTRQTNSRIIHYKTRQETSELSVSTQKGNIRSVDYKQTGSFRTVNEKQDGKLPNCQLQTKQEISELPSTNKTGYFRTPNCKAKHETSKQSIEKPDTELPNCQ